MEAFLGQQLHLERLQPERQLCSSLPDSFRIHEPEGRILGSVQAVA